MFLRPYDQLFGEDSQKSCIDVLWEQTYGTLSKISLQVNQKTKSHFDLYVLNKWDIGILMNLSDSRLDLIVVRAFS